MKKTFTLQLITLSALVFSQSVIAQGGWVAPGEYTFGRCGRVSGGRVPTTLSANQKYYNQFSCVSAYTTVDVCFQHAQQIQYGLNQYGTLPQCIDWLKSELSSCRDFVGNAVLQCMSARV
jgi:hypothetical protein